MIIWYTLYNFMTFYIHYSKLSGKSSFFKNIFYLNRFPRLYRRSTFKTPTFDVRFFAVNSILSIIPLSAPFLWVFSRLNTTNYTSLRALFDIFASPFGWKVEFIGFLIYQWVKPVFLKAHADSRYNLSSREKGSYGDFITIHNFIIRINLFSIASDDHRKLLF